MTEFGKAITTTSISKLVLNREHQFAYCFAGDDCAVHVGDAIQTSMREGTFDKAHIKECLQTIANKQVKYEKERWLNRGANWSEIDRSLLLVFYGNPPQLWRLRISETSIAQQHHDKITAGSSGNTARFFIEQYYESKKSVWDLLPLAAHFIFMGNARTPETVRGFEAYLFGDSVGVIHLTEKDAVVGELRTISDRLNTQIRGKLTKWNFRA